jgi:hypothetical protein
MLRIHGAQHCTMDVWFIFPINTALLPLKTCQFSANLKFSLYHVN